MNQSIVITLLVVVVVILVGAVAYLVGQQSNTTPEPVSTGTETTDIGAPVDMADQQEEESGDTTPDEPFTDEDADTGCTVKDDCAQGEYCQFAEGQCGGVGECVTQPELCTLHYDPVCGCDNKTYGNSCGAASAGVSVASEGVCIIACTSNDDCDSSEFCAREGVNKCEGPGVCQVRPEACPAVFVPSCGCDGSNYNGPCGAHKAGVNISKAGFCF